MTEIPGYRIRRELGHGGMATVYLAVQESLERSVALKVMAPALATDRTFTQRFVKEGKTIAKFNHPHIVGIYDVGVSNGYHYIAMEHVGGGDLKTRLRGDVDKCAVTHIGPQRAASRRRGQVPYRDAACTHSSTG